MDFHISDYFWMIFKKITKATTKTGFLIAVRVSLQQQFSLNMDDYFDSVSIFLTEECKESSRLFEQPPPIEKLGFEGRWTEEEWNHYVFYSFKQICQNKQSLGYLKQIQTNRRSYNSFDRRFVEFVNKKMLSGRLTKQQHQILRKRTKSKFNTLKRKFKSKRKRQGPKNFFEHFQQMIYQDAKKLSESQPFKGIKQYLELYQTQLRVKSNPEISEPREHKPLRRYSTRSSENNQVKIEPQY